MREMYGDGRRGLDGKAWHSVGVRVRGFRLAFRARSSGMASYCMDRGL